MEPEKEEKIPTGGGPPNVSSRVLGYSGNLRTQLSVCTSKRAPLPWKDRQHFRDGKNITQMKTFHYANGDRHLRPEEKMATATLTPTGLVFTMSGCREGCTRDSCGRRTRATDNIGLRYLAEGWRVALQPCSLDRARERRKDPRGRGATQCIGWGLGVLGEPQDPVRRQYQKTGPRV